MNRSAATTVRSWSSFRVRRKSCKPRWSSSRWAHARSQTQAMATPARHTLWCMRPTVCVAQHTYNWIISYCLCSRIEMACLSSLGLWVETLLKKVPQQDQPIVPPMSEQSWPKKKKKLFSQLPGEFHCCFFFFINIYDIRWRIIVITEQLWLFDYINSQAYIEPHSHPNDPCCKKIFWVHFMFLDQFEREIKCLINNV